MNSIRTLLIGLGLFTTASLYGQTASSQDSLSSIQIELASGQVEPLSLNATDMRAVRSLSEAQLAAFVLALDATPLTAFDQLPRKGQAATFYSLQHPDWPPLPSNTSQSAVWKMNDFYLLDDVDYNYNAPVKSRTGMQAMTLSGPPSPGGAGGGGTNGYFPNGSSYAPPDYGTNLWIAQVAITNGYLAGIASNTLAEIRYELEYATNLTPGGIQSNWLSTGRFIFGSETTNWTALGVLPVSRTNNLFFRLRSWQDSDGSGLPDWWEQEYGVTDPYGDPDADGWNNLQEFQRGTSPLAFDQPPAPQGLTVALHQSGQTASLGWLPSPGAVTGYTVEKTDAYASPTTVQTYVLPASATSFADDIADNGAARYYAYYGHSYGVAYRVQAHYAGGASAWSAPAPLQTPTVAGAIAAGAGGDTYLAVTGLPADAVAVQLVYVDEGADVYKHDASFDSVHDLAAAGFTNGLQALPAAWQPPAADAYGAASYDLYVRSVDAAGNASKSVRLVGGWQGWAQYYHWNEPFYDGRAALKQNLIFQLRIADSVSSFGLIGYTYDLAAGHGLPTTLSTPANYVYAGIYDINNTNGIYGQNGDAPVFNSVRPFEDNTLYRNFVFDPALLDANGILTTGAHDDSYMDDGLHLGLQLPPAWLPTTNVAGFAPLLDTNSTRWLAAYPAGQTYFATADPAVLDFLNGLTYVLDGLNRPVLHFAANARNYWGLPYSSAKVYYYEDDGQNLADHVSSTTLYPGGTLSTWEPTAIYMETAPPQFQTVAYDFWNDASLAYKTNTPGSWEFSPANASDLLLVGVGQSIPISAYAKLAVQNGYTGVYGYLGQYFDQAYEINTNGVATTNTTGVLSPYGSFFATEPGQAALVTMPDLDTGERGTGIVHCVSLQVDKNHDGNMDSSFNGPDATSETSPMVCWVNNGYIKPGSNGDLDQDLPLPLNDLKNANYSQGKITCQRDLENFFRLWIRGVPQLPSDQGYTVTFSLTALSGDPAINLYSSSDSAGGTGYLTDTNVAADQARTEMSPNPEFGVALATINAQQSYTLPANFFDYNYPYYSRFLFEGAGIGLGQLTLTISQNSNVIVQASAYLDLHDVKDLYQRVKVTPRDPSGILAPYNEAGTFDETTADVDISSDGYGFTPAADEDKTALVFVHGSNLSVPVAIDNGETMFKRLYWQGYNGRFVLFYWNTLVGPFTGTIPAHYNENEFRAFKYGLALKNYVENDLPTNYTKNVIGHSLGNMVITSALYPRGSAPGMAANNVIFMQAALPASCYDPNAATLSTLTDQESSQPTPDWFSTQMGYRGLTATNINATLYNIYNPEDYALGYWVDNQEFFKPENLGSPLLLGYGVTPEPGTEYEWDSLAGGVLYYEAGLLHRPVIDPQESMSFIARSRMAALGTMAVGGSISTTNCLTCGIWNSIYLSAWWFEARP